MWGHHREQSLLTLQLGGGFHPASMQHSVDEEGSETIENSTSCHPGQNRRV
jgi:hypothetical protein